MTDLYAEAMVRVRDLLEEARASGDPEPTAMTLATLGEAGRVSARTVLLKGFDPGGFVFYTNCESRKGIELRAHPQVALLFHWRHIRHGVQLRVEGIARQVDDDEADRYFASRPRMSQVGAWASDQSRTLDSREQFDARINEVEARFDGQPVPRPPHWSGYRVEPDAIELWFGAVFRLHERYLYERAAGGAWAKRMVFP